ncbi:sulfurtransferase [Hydrogenimonas cancrithermarum]|uniref:Sulfurtransferase n=1 Tax=Hydrogenimonas cancrithermarum TaxID=2993563 RepID=A0ABM8FJB6_9BACT|nr:sulfurtransferase [Hydrogenimonas cancrithermarum]BDY12384.1 sulfurtransferase [Hydrogenimonas cancrithermarum]
MIKILMLVAVSLSLFAMEPLVNAEWLKAHLNDKDLVIVDLSSKKLYVKGHIPGAVQSGIGKWRKVNGKFALVRSMEEIETLMRRLGIGKESRVVVYSHHSNSKDMLKPSYVIWAMELYGFKNTAMLDGGLKAWRKAGGKLSKAIPAVEPGDFEASFHPKMAVDLKGVEARIGKVRMLDARPAVFYFGARKQPALKRAGHVSGASSYFWKYSFNDDGTMKPAATIEAMLVDGMGLDPEKEIVTYCTGGLETSMNYFVLHRLLGFTKAKLYDASMKEWANRDDTPMTKYRWE